MKNVAFVVLTSCFFYSSLVQADEAAVRRTLAEYVDVFNRKAVDRVAGFWTEQGSHTDRETGQRTAGRAAIQADMMKVFTEHSDCRLSATIEGIRFITSDVSSVEGETTVLRSGAEPVVSSYTAILVRQGEQWLLDSVEEFNLPKPVSSTDALQQLEWLIGDWVDDSGDVRVSTNFRWTANRAFLLRSYTVDAKDGVVMTGTQVIGWDPRSEQIRSWSFSSDGSFGESTWSRNGESWLSKSTQTLPAGDIASGTYIVERVDRNAFTMQLVGHEVNGEPQTAGAAVRIVRVSEKPAAEAVPQN